VRNAAYDRLTSGERFEAATRAVKQTINKTLTEKIEEFYPALPDVKKIVQDAVDAVDFRGLNDALHMDTQQRIGHFMPPTLLTEGEENND
jgi:hypothetical protein